MGTNSHVMPTQETWPPTYSPEVPSHTPTITPANSGEPTTIKKVGDNIRAINQQHWIEGTFLGALTRNAEATMRMSVAALKVAGNAYITNIIEASPVGVVPQIIASSIGLLLYGGSLVSSAALKAAIWVPVLSISFFSGLLGGTVGFIFSGFNQDYAKKGFMGISDLTAKVLSNPTTLAASLTVFARGPVHLLGILGGIFLGTLSVEYMDRGMVKCTDKESITVAAALFQTCEDSYALWTWGMADILTAVDPQENKTNTNTKEFLTTLAEIGANFHSLCLNQKSPFSTSNTPKWTATAKEYQKILKELGILEKLDPKTF